MDTYLARQPIFSRTKEIYAYELLFRGGMQNYFPEIDGSSATSRVLSNLFFNADIETITGGKRAFINFTYDLLLKKIPLMFPSEITTVEILEHVAVDEALLECCREFLKRGYVLALDDFDDVPGMEPLLSLAHIIKIDFMKSSREEIEDFARRFIPEGKKLLAEKVETMEEFQEALAMGFSYFQGYFFSRPQVMRERDIGSLKMNLLQIMSEAGSSEFSISRLEKLISRDVGISYKLLRYLNSPYFRRANEISSIRHAIVMLGENGIKRFLSVIVLAELSDDKPSELLKSSVIRARFCENLALQKGFRPDPSELFTLGLFSLIDAILECPMESIMKKLPLSSGIKSCLAGKSTAFRAYLECTIHYEQAHWDEVFDLAHGLDIDVGKLPQIYLDALGWADALFSSRE